jgi:hypothetical protein
MYPSRTLSKSSSLSYYATKASREHSGTSKIVFLNPTQVVMVKTKSILKQINKPWIQGSLGNREHQQVQQHPRRRTSTQVTLHASNAKGGDNMFEFHSGPHECK